MNRRTQSKIIVYVLSITLSITILLQSEPLTFIIGKFFEVELERVFNYNQLRFFLTLFPIAIILISVGNLVFYYLQGEFTNIGKTNKINDDNVLIEVEKFKKELLNTVEKNKLINFDENNIKEVIDEKIDKITNESLIEIIKNNYEEKLKEEFKTKTLEDELTYLKIRIGKETERASRNGNINLSIGVFTTLLAIFFLAYSLLYSTTQTNTSAVPVASKSPNTSQKLQNNSITKQQDLKIADSKTNNKKDTKQDLSTATFLYHFIPRLSLSILIELFSFFFLRIYRRNLDDIKYLNNESTNVDLKLIALRTAILYEDTDSLKSVISELSKTERNFILKQGESTVEVEKVKVEVSSSDRLLDNIVKIINRK